MELTYNNIQAEVKKFASSYRKTHSVPQLPSEKELKPIADIYFSKFSYVVELVEQHMSGIESTITHGMKHLKHVALLGTYIVGKECRIHNIPKKDKEAILDTTFISGFLHDIDRHLGFGEIHMIEGEKTTKIILQKAGIVSEKVPLIVKNHDRYDFNPGEDIVLSLAFSSVFDADHFMYGWEREDIFWQRGKIKGTAEEEIIHDYKFLYPLKNAWKTRYGKKVGPKLIDFGLAIAKHIEKTFS